MTTQNAIELAIDALHDAEIHFLMEAGKDAGSPCETRSARYRWNTKQAVYFHEALEALESLRAAQKVDVMDTTLFETSLIIAEKVFNMIQPGSGNEDRLFSISRYDAAKVVEDEILNHLAATGRLAGIPEGYVLVPLEETEKIRDAVERHIDNYGTLYDAWYEDMIAAAQEEK